MMIKPDTKPRAAGSRPMDRTLPAAVPAAARQAQALGTLLGQAIARGAANGTAGAALVPLVAHVDTWNELAQMQSAVWDRTQQLQQDWLQAWSGWLQEFTGLKRANTLSEHVEQQFNIAAQAGSLVKDQAADMLNLQENLQVDYGYWLAQKARELSGRT